MPDWNVSILLFLLEIRTPLGVNIAEMISMLGGPSIIIAVALVSAYILSRGRPWAHALGLIVSIGGAFISAELLKNVLQYDRPDSVLWAVSTFDYGFPSIHAASSMALYGFLIWYAWEVRFPWRRLVTTFFGLIILAVGFTRLYLGVHWPIDVLGGYLVGFIFIIIGSRITRKFESYE